MTNAALSTALATIQPAFTDPERLALAGYRGLTREAYALDLRQFATWCRARSLALFAVRRSEIEGFARELEVRSRARATVTRRLSTIAGFYRTRSKKNSSITHLPHMSAVPGWIMSRMRSPWTVTSSARCWWPPGSARRPSMH
jgi:hypothetical protein